MNPFYAYCYAEVIDCGCPQTNTREAACKNPEYAYKYAKEIDRRPYRKTREAVCKNPEYAYLYAKDVDKESSNETWMAVKNTKYEEEYRKLFNDPIKELII